MPPANPITSRRASAFASAFTQVELIIVVTVVGVLTAIAFPIYQRVTQGGRAVACFSNLRQLGAALNLYVGEHNMTLPTMMAGRNDRREDVPVIDTVLANQTADPRVFICPADAKGKGAQSGTSYYWNSVLNGQNLATLNFFNHVDTTYIPVLSDKEGFHPYEPFHVNILYADGHAAKELKFSTDKPQ